MAADRPPYPDAGDDTAAESDGGSTARVPQQRPRWVRVSMVIAIVLAALIVLVVILQLLGVGGGMGGHGPDRHLGAAPVSVAEASTRLS